MAGKRKLTAKHAEAVLTVMKMIEESDVLDVAPTDFNVGVDIEADLGLEDIEFGLDGLLDSSAVAKHVETDLKPLPGGGTHPISLRAPKWVIFMFKQHSGKDGKGYQTKMLRVLTEAARKMRAEDVERARTCKRASGRTTVKKPATGKSRA